MTWSEGWQQSHEEVGGGNKAVIEAGDGSVSSGPEQNE